MHISFPREVSFYFVGFTILLIIISSLFQIKDFWLRSITALLLPIVFTYASGLLFLRIFRLNWFDKHGILFRIVSVSLIGLIINASVFSFLGLVGLFTGTVLIGYFLSVLAVYMVLYNINSNRTNSLKTNNKFNFYSIVPIVVISFFSLGVAIWFQPPDSFPNMAGWDVYTHMLTVRTIIVQHGISELNLVYLPVIHYFYAAESILTNTDPFLLYWGSIYFIFPLGGASLYLLAFRLSNDKLIGISTGVFGITIGSTNEALGFIFPYPSTYGLIIVILANTILLNKVHKKFVVIYLISVGVVYYPALAANFIIFIGMLLHNTRRAIYYPALAITVLLFVVGSYLGGSVLGEGGVIFSTEQIWKIVSTSYVGERGLILVLLGCLFIAYRKAHNRRIILIGISTLTIFLVMLSGSFVSAYRFEEFVRPYIAFAMGFGVGSLCTLVANTVQQFRMSKRNHIS